MSCSGILLIDKEEGSTSFRIVTELRNRLAVKTIGHAGTLDPFATGVMVMLIGKEFTRQSASFLNADKSYQATIRLGNATTTFDLEGETTLSSTHIPTDEEIDLALETFQGTLSQIPPMFSAKKVGGKKLCDLARKGIEIRREPVLVEVQMRKVCYRYPFLEIEVVCSKGTYIRSLAHDMGTFLKCYGHLTQLRRVRSGSFSIDSCIPQAFIRSREVNLEEHFI